LAGEKSDTISLNSPMNISRVKDPKPESPHRLLLLSIIAGLAALIAVTTTINDIGITWDEPFYYKKCLEQLAWFNQAVRDFSQGEWRAPFSPEALSSHTTFRPLEERIYYTHPPFFKICSSLTLVLFEPWLGAMGAFRISPAIMFSLLVSLLFFTVGRRYGILAGLWAAASFALMPRVFGHAHLGASDTPITLLWFASAVSFHRALESRRWAPVFALVYGLALATKFTAFLIPLPLAVYVLLSRRFKQAAWPVGIALVVSPLIMLGMIPQWWHNTVDGLHSFIIGSVTRSGWANISTYYLGKHYSFNSPWHHSLVYTLFTVPPQVLALFFYGLWRTLRRPFTDQWATHMGLHWLVFMLVMMFPGAPGYDGVRLFLPAFAFLAVISAKGFYHFANQDLPLFLARIPRLGSQMRALAAPVVLVVMVIPSTVILARLHPFELCYYNCLAGGISGARELGMETTYWYDAVNDQACRSINETLPDSAVLSTTSDSYFLFLQQLGKIKPSLRFSKADFGYILQYSRQGIFSDHLWMLYRRGRPLWELKKDGVRLLAIFQCPRVYHEILANLKNSKTPESLYEMSLAYKILGLPDSSFLALKKYLEYKPIDFQANLEMVSYYLGRKLPNEAFKHLQRVADSPEDPNLWHYKMAEVYYERGELEQAIASFREVLKNKKYDYLARSNIGNIYYRMGRLQDSAEQFELVLYTDPCNELVLLKLGMINQELKITERAKYYYDRLLEVNPWHLEALNSLAVLEYDAGEIKQAEELYIRALAVDSNNLSANFNLGYLYAETGRLDLARKYYRIVLKERPDDSQIHLALVNLYMKDPDYYAEALEHLGILVRLIPEQAELIKEKYIRPLEVKLNQRAVKP